MFVCPSVRPCSRVCVTKSVHVSPDLKLSRDIQDFIQTFLPKRFMIIENRDIQDTDVEPTQLGVTSRQFIRNECGGKCFERNVSKHIRNTFGTGVVPRLIVDGSRNEA